jgi:phosphotriesterase-related protein
MRRRKFLDRVCRAVASAAILPFFSGKPELRIQAVAGPIPASRMGTTLPHEHVMVDFIGADQASPFRYSVDEVIAKALPHLKQLKLLGCRTLIECTPAYLGRDPVLLRLLSEHSGLNIITNTGYYAAVQGKYLPASVSRQSAQELADLWTAEFARGIDGTGVRPGFIKTSVDGAPLTDYNNKVIEAAAIAHKQTGLTIACHCGSGEAALEALRRVTDQGVRGNAFIWVHAQNAGSTRQYLDAASKGAWIELDGLSEESIDDHLERMNFLKLNGLLGQALVSHDAGWYHVGEPDGGTYRSHDLLFTRFIPLLRSNGYSAADIRRLTERNPASAFAIQRRLV